MKVSLPCNYFGNDVLTPRVSAFLTQAISWSIRCKIVFQGFQYPADEMAGFGLF